MPKKYLSADEKRAHMLRSLHRTVQQMGCSVRFKLIPNDMAGGPCAGCLGAAERIFTIDEPILMPLADCPRPSQCSGAARIESWG